eukprot:scpid106401/ scgid7107/ 
MLERSLSQLQGRSLKQRRDLSSSSSSSRSRSPTPRPDRKPADDLSTWSVASYAKQCGLNTHLLNLFEETKSDSTRLLRPSRLDAACRQLNFAPRVPSAEELVTAIRRRLTLRGVEPPRRHIQHNHRKQQRPCPQPRPVRPTRHRY